MCLKMLKYSKIDLMDDADFQAVENFVESVNKVNVYVSDLNPVSNTKATKTLKYENVNLSLVERKLNFGDGTLSFHIEASRDTNVYVGNNDMLVELPRGYKGLFTYYYFEPISE